jgi:hypothetical protein
LRITIHTGAATSIASSAKVRMSTAPVLSPRQRTPSGWSRWPVSRAGRAIPLEVTIGPADAFGLVDDAVREGARDRDGHPAPRRHAVVVTVRAVVGWLPEPWSRGIGTLIGLVFYVIDGAHRRIAVSQLRAAFPVRSSGSAGGSRGRVWPFWPSARRRPSHEHRSQAQILASVEFSGEERIRTRLPPARRHYLRRTFRLLGAGRRPDLVLPPMSVLARRLDNRA